MVAMRYGKFIYGGNFIALFRPVFKVWRELAAHGYFSYSIMLQRGLISSMLIGKTFCLLYYDKQVVGI